MKITIIIEPYNFLCTWHQWTPYLDKEAFKNDENNQTVVIQNTSEKTEDKIERQVIASTSEIMTEVGMAEIEKDEVTVG